MELTPAERQELAEELLLSMSDDDRKAIDEAWLEEARRRDADYQSGKTGAKSVDEVVQRLRQLRGKTEQ